MTEPALDYGDATAVPSWVPELRAGVRADVYPVSPPPAEIASTPTLQAAPAASGASASAAVTHRAELVLDRDTVTAGYAERRPPYEFGSLLAIDAVQPDALAKIRVALAKLRKSRPAAPQRVPLPAYDDPLHPLGDAQAALGGGGGGAAALAGSAAVSGTGGASASMPGAAAGATAGAAGVAAATAASAGAATAAVPVAAAATRKSQFPLQKPSAKSTLEDWFNKLASGGAFSTATLSRAVPLGPAIVRAVGKVLEMMSMRGVPTQRAVWYIRIAVLNECVKQIRPDRPAPSPRVFWTRQLCGLLKTEIDAMHAKKFPPNREEFWDYVLDLARWQADEALLDVTLWLERVAACVKSEVGLGGGLALGPAGRVSLRAAEIFVSYYKTSRQSAVQLTEALLAAVDMVGGPEAVAASSSGEPSGVQESGGGVLAAASQDTTAPAYRVVSLLRELIPSLGARASSPDADPRGTDAQSKKILPGTAALPQIYTAAALALSSGAVGEVLPVPAPAPALDSAEEDENFMRASRATLGPHAVSRVLERLPGCGDIYDACQQVIAAFAGEGRGGPRAAIPFLCAWAVRGPMRKSPFAVLVASAVIAGLSETCRAPEADTGDRSEAEPSKPKAQLRSGASHIFQHEIWEFLNSSAESTSTASPEARGGDEQEEDLFGFVIRADEAKDEECRSILLVANLYRIGQFSLNLYLKDVARLVSAASPHVARHLAYIAALPEPGDVSLADSRRALLRRGQRVTRQVLASCEHDEIAVQAVSENDVVAAVRHGIRVNESRAVGVALATGEHMMFMDHTRCAAPEQRVRAVLGFLSASGCPALAVEWILRQLDMETKSCADLGNSSPGLAGDLAAAKAMVFALEDLAPFVAASGLLELTLHRLAVLYSVHLQKATDAGSAGLCAAVEYVASSYCASFAPNSGSGNSRWVGWVVKVVGDGSRSLTTTLLRGSDASQHLSDEAILVVRDSLGARTAGADIDDKFAARGSDDLESLWGISPDDDLEQMTRIRERFPQLKTVAQFIASYDETEEPTECCPAVEPWVTANMLIGGAVLPELRKALQALDQSELDGGLFPGNIDVGEEVVEAAGGLGNVMRLDNAAKGALQVLKLRIGEHAHIGMRAALAIELVAVFSAACLTNLPSLRGAFSELVQMPWVWTAINPRAGAAVASRLRKRLELSLQGRSIDQSRLAAVVCDALERFSGPRMTDNSADTFAGSREAAVVERAGREEWGRIELAVSALAAIRAAAGEMTEFATAVGESISKVRNPDYSELLVTVISQSVTEGSIPPLLIVVANVLVQALAEGFGILVNSAVQSSERRSHVAARHSEQVARLVQDSANCAALTRLLSLLKRDDLAKASAVAGVGGMVTSLVEQMNAAAEALAAPGACGLLRPDISPDGTSFSTAVEYRFRGLAGILGKVSAGNENKSENSSDASARYSAKLFAECAMCGCALMGIAGPLLLPSAFDAGIAVVQQAMAKAESAGMAVISVPRSELQDAGAEGLRCDRSDERAPSADPGADLKESGNGHAANTGTSDADISQGDAELVSVPLRSRAHALLSPARVWLTGEQQDAMNKLCATGESENRRRPFTIRARRANGEEVDAWYLLEGYGRGADEEAAVPLAAFAAQEPQEIASGGAGEAGDASCGTRLPLPDDRVIRLKRTYSTYACSAVR